MTKRRALLDQLHNDAEEPDQHRDVVGAYGLTQKEVDRLQQIITKDSGVVLSNAEAWQRATELIAFAKVLLESLSPEQSLTKDKDSQ